MTVLDNLEVVSILSIGDVTIRAFPGNCSADYVIETTFPSRQRYPVQSMLPFPSVSSSPSLDSM
jgi:hypothetical protein